MSMLDKQPIWEYKIVEVTISNITEANLNALGKLGWELLPFPPTQINSRWWAVFKRLKR